MCFYAISRGEDPMVLAYSSSSYSVSIYVFNIFVLIEKNNRCACLKTCDR